MAVLMYFLKARNPLNPPVTDADAAHQVILIEGEVVVKARYSSRSAPSFSESKWVRNICSLIQLTRKTRWS